MSNHANPESAYLFGRKVTELSNDQVCVELDGEYFYMSNATRLATERQYLANQNCMSFLLDTIGKAEKRAERRAAGQSLKALCMRH